MEIFLAAHMIKLETDLFLVISLFRHYVYVFMISYLGQLPQKNSQQKRSLGSSSILPGVMSSKDLFFCWNLQQKMQELKYVIFGILKLPDVEEKSPDLYHQVCSSG
jgi:hypothetical protein